jgi:hypothetical protein
LGLAGADIGAGIRPVIAAFFHRKTVSLRTLRLRAIAWPDTPLASGLRLEFPAKSAPGSAWRVSRIKT